MVCFICIENIAMRKGLGGGFLMEMLRCSINNSAIDTFITWKDNNNNGENHALHNEPFDT